MKLPPVPDCVETAWLADVRTSAARTALLQHVYELLLIYTHYTLPTCIQIPTLCLVLYSNVTEFRNSICDNILEMSICTISNRITVGITECFGCPSLSVGYF